jgi:hypothetical protein
LYRIDYKKRPSNLRKGPKKFINNFLKMVKEPFKYWDKLNYNEKRTFQNILFPEGFRFSLKNKEYRMPKMNLMLELTNCYSDYYTNKKEKTQKLKAFKSSIVAGTGFFPTRCFGKGQNLKLKQRSTDYCVIKAFSFVCNLEMNFDCYQKKSSLISQGASL